MRSKLLSLFLFLSSLSGSAEECTVIQDTCGLTIATPSLSKREIRKIRLNNGLEALLISDPETHQSGAALAVEAGSWNDPKEFPGMAHFVEHMLFLGTEKYPKEEEYFSFLNEHGGMHNAFTLADRTVYMFSVDTDAFHPALDRFGQFFISPLFSPSGLERECQAVHQEYCKNIPIDFWRLLFVKKELSNPQHPFHDFCIGNQETLRGITHEHAKTWYQAHYSANLMHLVLYSSLSLDEMQHQASSIFSKVHNLDLSPQTISHAITHPQTHGKIVHIQPVQQLQVLELAWELPRIFGQDTETHADKLVSTVLGHEGPTSLLAQLKREGLAENLSAGTYRAGQDQCFYCLDIYLTSKGLESYASAIQRCFEAIASLQNSGIPKYVYDEYAEMEKLRYTFQSRKKIFDIVSEYASGIIEEGLDTFPQKQTVPSRYDRENIDLFLRSMTPETCQYTLIAPSDQSRSAGKVKEKWLGGEYTVEELSPRFLERLGRVLPHPQICIPAPNRFLPQNLDVHARENENTETLLPQVHLLCDQAKGKLYYSSDSCFLIPEVCWNLRIKTPAIRDAQPKSHVLADLFCHAIQEHLRSLAYEANMAGLHYKLQTAHAGLALQIKGFNDKASDFLSEIISALTQFKPSRELFSLYRESVLRAYQNEIDALPVKQSKYLLWKVLYKDYPSLKEKEALLLTLRFNDFQAFCQSLWSETYVEGLLYGNLSGQQEAENVWEVLDRHFTGGYTPDRHPSVQIADFSSLDQPVYLEEQTRHPANALILATDCGPFTFKRRAAQQILVKGLKEPFFSELRTRQQTAYLLTNWGEELERRLYTFFAIQSSSHESRDLLSRFELFLENSMRELSATLIPESKFETIRKTCLHKLKHSASNLVEMGDYLFLLAFDYEGDFDWLEKRIQGLEELTYAEFLECAEEFLGKENQKRIAVCMQGTFPEKKGYRKVAPPLLRKEISYSGKEERIAA